MEVICLRKNIGVDFGPQVSVWMRQIAKLEAKEWAEGILRSQVAAHKLGDKSFGMMSFDSGRG